MQHNKRRVAVRWVRWVVLATLAAGSGAVARADIIEQILVKVNGEIITKTDLEARQVAVLGQRGQ